MPFLIYTDKENLLKSVKAARVRVPSHLTRHFDLGKIRPKDTIFLFDYESGKVHGPFTAVSPSVREERNPRGGPFNGYGRVKGHYLYRSVDVDCALMYRRGAPFEEFSCDFRRPRFALTPDEERRIDKKLRLRNRRSIPLVLNVSCDRDLYRVTAVEMNRGMKIRHHTLSLRDGFFALLERKVRLIEECLGAGRERGLASILRSAGQVIYEQVLAPCGLDRLFSEGGFTVDLAGDSAMLEVPFEIAWNGSFVFENNVFAYRREGEAEGDATREGEPFALGRALVIADPAGTFPGAYREGVKLHRYLSGRGLPADLLTRPLRRGALIDMLPSYDLVHFTGHSLKEGGSGAWDLGDSGFGERDVIPRGRFPRLVFSSSCGNTLPLGFTLVGAGARNAVSSRWAIPDRDFSGFLIDFYGLLLDGVEIGSAFNEATVNCYLRGDLSPLSFGLLGESRRAYAR